MSKRAKATVSYFPHLINQGKTIYVLESKFGNNGYSTLFKILEILGQSEYHFYDCTEKNNWEYLLAKTHLEDKILNEIIEMMVSLGTIDEELWKYKILFSQQFIDNIEDVYKRRVIQVPTKEFICRKIGINLKDKCLHLSVSNGQNVNKNPQSKVKESKVKENIYTLSSLFSKIENKFTPEELKHKQPFLEHWMEKSEGGRKERWEMEKVFNVNKRFHTWLRNAKKWGKMKENTRQGPRASTSCPDCHSTIYEDEKVINLYHCYKCQKDYRLKVPEQKEDKTDKPVSEEEVEGAKQKVGKYYDNFGKSNKEQ